MSDLFDELEPDESPAHLAGSIALLAMMNPVSLGCDDWLERFEGLAHLDALSVDARKIVEKIAADLDAATEGGSRTDEANC